MNIIEAGMSVGQCLASRYVSEGEALVTHEALTSLLGEEMATRAGELFDRECARYCFSGYKVAIGRLDALRAPAEERDPVQYWIALREAVEDCPELSRMASSVEKVGEQAESIICATLSPGAEYRNDDNDVRFVDAVSTFAASMKRSGALRTFMRSGNAGGNPSSADLTEYLLECDERYAKSLASYLGGYCPDAHQGIPERIRRSLEGLAFAINLARKSVFWGFESQVHSVDAADCDVDQSAGRGLVSKVSLTTSDVVFVLNKRFAAVKLLDGNGVVGYFIPSRQTMTFRGNGVSVSSEGLLYPASDVGLFAPGGSN